MASSKRCCVPNCNVTRYNDNTTLHSFPNPVEEADRFRRWKYAIGRDIWTLDNQLIYKHRKVCHKHFETKHQTWTKRLSPDAIPTLHLSGAYMHRFPHPERRPEIFTTWMSIARDRLHYVDPVRVYRNKRICDYHFRFEDKVSGRRLMVSAVPCLHLNGVFSLSTSTLAQMEHNYCMPGMHTRSFSQQNSAEIITDEDGTVTIKGDDTEVSTCLENQDDVSLYRDDDPPPASNVSSTEGCYFCNVCKGSIRGFRYTCVQCADWDVCGACEARAAHAEHYLLRVPSQRPYKEIQAVLTAIRQQLMSEKILPEKTFNYMYSVKEEPKSDPEEHSKAWPAAEPDPLDWDDDSVIETGKILIELEGGDHPPLKRLRPGSSRGERVAATPESSSESSRRATRLRYNTSLTSSEDIPAKLPNDNPTRPNPVSIPIFRTTGTPTKSNKTPTKLGNPRKMLSIKPSTLPSGIVNPAPSEDKSRAHHRAEQAAAAVAPPGATRARAPGRRQLLRVPRGSRPAVVKALKSKVSVRLKPIRIDAGAARKIRNDKTEI